MERYLHSDVVMVQPGLDDQLRGRKACIKTYEQFMAHSIVEKCKESEHSIESWRSVAVALYRFNISYETRGKSYHDVGHEVFVLVRDRSRWQAVWRTILPEH